MKRLLPLHRALLLSMKAGDHPVCGVFIPIGEIIRLPIIFRIIVNLPYSKVAAGDGLSWQVYDNLSWRKPREAGGMLMGF